MSFKAMVDVIEPLGSEIHLLFDIGEPQFRGSGVCADVGTGSSGGRACSGP